MLKEFLLQHNQWALLTMSSICVALITVALDWAATWANDLKYGYCASNLLLVRESCPAGEWSSYSSHLPLRFMVGIFLTLGFSFISVRIALQDSNIPQSGIGSLIKIITGTSNPEFLSTKVILGKVISLIFAIASGALLIGYEGPLIHISSGILAISHSIFIRFSYFQNLSGQYKLRELLSIGFVIGISLAFGTPIGGLLFAVETLNATTSKFMWNGFVSASVATFILVQIHPFRVVTVIESFIVDGQNKWVGWESGPYLIVGLVVGFAGLAYDWIHKQITNRREEFLGKFLHFGEEKVKMFEVVSVSLIVGLLKYPLSFSSQTMVQLLLHLFDDCSSSTQSLVCQATNETFDLIYFLPILFIFSNYTYSTNVPGGVLLPSLTIGAVIGRLLGLVTQFTIQNWLDAPVTPGSYAAVGAAAMFAAVTNTSMSAIVIVFEMTGAVTYLVPLMAGVLIARCVNDIIAGGEGFYSGSTQEGLLEKSLEDSMRLAKFGVMSVGEIVTSSNSSNDYSIEFASEGSTASEGKILLNNRNSRELLSYGYQPASTLHVVKTTLSLLVVYEIIDRLDTNIVFVEGVEGGFEGFLTKEMMIELVKNV